MDSETFNIVADTIAEECAVPRDKITPDSHVIDDLGLDSIAFLDTCYALDVKLNIKIPFAQWVSDINAGKWLDTLPVTNGTIFAYVMNNYWFTNYKAGQDGDFTFRYSLTSASSISWCPS